MKKDTTPAKSWKDGFIKNNNSNFIASGICFALYLFIESNLLLLIKYGFLRSLLLFLAIIFLLGGLFGWFLKNIDPSDSPILTHLKNPKK